MRIFEMIAITLAFLVKVAAVAIIVALGYGIWQYCVLVSQCGTELKVIITTIAGLAVIGIILFSISLYSKTTRMLSVERYRRKLDAYTRLLPSLFKVFQISRKFKGDLPERAKEQFNLVMLELGILADDDQIDILGDLRQSLDEDDLSLDEMLFFMERFLRKIRLDLKIRNSGYEYHYSVNRLWVDNCDRMMAMIEEDIRRADDTEKSG